MSSVFYSGASDAPLRQNSRPDALSRPKLVYHYFNIRGRGETARMICALGGLEYTDNRVDNWSEIKQKYSSKRLPVLEVDGEAIDQSSAICRYLAKEAGLAGADYVENFRIDSLAESITEVREKCGQIVYVQDEGQKKKKMVEIKKFTDDVLGHVERQLRNNGGGRGFLVGNKLSWADLHLFCVWELITPVMPEAFSSTPLLAALIQRIRQQPRVAKYLSTRPQTP